MADLVVVVPSRGRPHAVAEMVEAFGQTCTTDTELVFALDVDDPTSERYMDAMYDARGCVVLVPGDNGSMVQALNYAAGLLADAPRPPVAIGFMGDDHRPRTVGWDSAYLDTLRTVPGMTFGNDLIQGLKLPTQIAMSTEIVRALGHMAPPPLTHMYVDNYWMQLGREAGCITYLPDVVVEHLHPSVGTAEWDEGYRRVNDPAMYSRDEAAADAYWAEHGARDVAAVRSALVGAVR